MRELATLCDPNSVLKAVSGLFFEYSFFFLFSFIFLSVLYSTAAELMHNSVFPTHAESLASVA